MPSAARMRPRCGEDSDEVDEEAARRRGVVDDVLDGFDVGGGLAGVELA